MRMCFSQVPVGTTPSALIRPLSWSKNPGERLTWVHVYMQNSRSALTRPHARNFIVNSTMRRSMQHGASRSETTTNKLMKAFKVFPQNLCVWSHLPPSVTPSPRLINIRCLFSGWGGGMFGGRGGGATEIADCVASSVLNIWLWYKIAVGVPSSPVYFLLTAIPILNRYILYSI